MKNVLVVAFALGALAVSARTENVCDFAKLRSSVQKLVNKGR